MERGVYDMYEGSHFRHSGPHETFEAQLPARTTVSHTTGCSAT